MHLAFESTRASSKIVFAPFGGAETMSQLKAFDARSASCYDPNVQTKILHIILMCGVEEFNDRIRELARKHP